MTKKRVDELRHLRVVLKSGEYDGTHIMAAWIALDEYAKLLERQPDEPAGCPNCEKPEGRINDLEMRLADINEARDTR